MKAPELAVLAAAPTTLGGPVAPVSPEAPPCQDQPGGARNPALNASNTGCSRSQSPAGVWKLRAKP